MKKIDGIYLRVKEVLAKPENKKRLTWGTVILTIIAVIISLLISFFPDKNARALNVAEGDGILFYAAAAVTIIAVPLVIVIPVLVGLIILILSALYLRRHLRFVNDQNQGNPN